jgi:hypothetical protein
LADHVFDRLARLKTSASKKSSTFELQSVHAARAFSTTVYFHNFREPKVHPIVPHEVFSHLLINRQVLLRAVKSLRQNVAPFVSSLIASHGSLSVYHFAFSTFPALFHYFTDSDSI